MSVYCQLVAPTDIGLSNTMVSEVVSCVKLNFLFSMLTIFSVNRTETKRRDIVVSYHAPYSGGLRFESGLMYHAVFLSTPSCLTP
jgi:hypothetical protein